ncbi:hypothetical protein IIV31_169R [Armadillidium vulgare iridescent virus]|uniref:MSV199 domain-containing protein n=1 Tax=Armadillidium vulgare iridescent virus TaxID=72201 RepID=A0A068QKR0_9VIRU|nr:hypothetical protein IIV31_169R [Armadillidium vulgare iridescent virus]CCV02541.1 hypothetical protein IIV31_169R [Armadillidium vulgare iridescent virus]
MEISSVATTIATTDKFWHSINENTPIYISREILDWMGYTGGFCIHYVSEKEHLKCRFLPLKQ